MRPDRRTVIAGTAALAISPAAYAAKPAGAARAVAWQAALERAFAVNDGTGLYREWYPAEPKDDRYSTEWPFSQAHIGLLDLSSVPGAVGRRFAPALARVRAAQQLYWSPTSTSGKPGHLAKVPPPRGPGDDLYYDDNEWVALAAIQHHLFRKDAASLAHARDIFELVRSGWSTDPKLPSPGGVRWTQKADNGDRNTVSNMPGAQIGVRLFELTRDRSYLDDALRYYRWTNATLQRPDGLYHDHLKTDGRIDERVWSYNQGVPVGVNVLLSRATGETRYLDEAKRIAAAAHAWFVTGNRMDREPPPFAAIYFKNLLLLESVTGGRTYRDAMRAYADRMWTTRRDPESGVLRPLRGRAELIDTGAIVQVEAVLAWNPADWPKLY
jgi:hypothetical protein